MPVTDHTLLRVVAVYVLVGMLVYAPTAIQQEPPLREVEALVGDALQQSSLFGAIPRVTKEEPHTLW